MVKERRSSQRRRSARNAQHNADRCVHAEKTLRDLGDKVPAEVRNEVEAKAAALKGILEAGSVEELKSKTDDLAQSVQKIGASMYQQPDATPPPDMGGTGGDTGPTSSGGDDVIDGEFTKN
jgi:molecular chaperone DnaK